MNITPKHECFETWRGKPGQSTLIAGLIAEHQDPDACLEWPYKKFTDGGYGLVRHAGRDWRVHRLAYRIFHGDLPPFPLILLHSCDNPPCFNPNHLSPGTKADNNRDMLIKGRARGGSLRGERNPLCKLTDEKVREIKRRCAAGEYQRDVAPDYGISHGLVAHIMAGKTWKHVTP